MARWQIVVKTSEAPKQTKDQNDNKNKQTNKQNKTKTTTTKRAERAGDEKQINTNTNGLHLMCDKPNLSFMTHSRPWKISLTCCHF